MSRRSIRPQRTRIFVGCEGRSEESYISHLRDLCMQMQLPLHIVLSNLHPEGDPLSRVETAVRKISLDERQREPFAYCFVLLDHDQAERDRVRGERAIQLSAQENIALIWQRPCHEAFLLRHLEGHQDMRPPDARVSEQALCRAWPDYRKPMDKRQLARRIDVQAIGRAAQVEPELAQFLSCLGLIA